MKEVDASSRRKFLLTGLMAGVAAGCNTNQNPFANTDETVIPSGEKVKLFSVDGEIIEMDKAFLKPVPDLPAVSNNEERKGIAGKKFVMVIDLSRCKNLKKCQTCLQSYAPCTSGAKLDKSICHAGCRSYSSLLATHYLHAL